MARSFVRSFAQHPHGIVPLHALVWTSLLDSTFPDMYGVGGVANVMHFIPLLSNVFKWLNTISADYNVLKAALQNNTHVFLLPDGIAGIYYAQRGQHAVVLKNRRGLFRLAMETEATILPVYCFGANDLFDQAATSDSVVGRVSRQLRVSLTLFWGQFFMPIPFGTNLTYVFCDPVSPPKLPQGGMDAPGFDARQAVEQFCQNHVKSLKEGFDRYKALAGYPDSELMIV